jgi:hypothetical protein
MNTKLRALVILLILCAALAAGYVLLPGSAPQDASSSSVTINDIPVGELKALALSTSQGIFGILNGPDGLSAVPEASLTFDEAQMRALVYAACHLTGIRRLDTFSLQESDIENPLARVTLILTGDRESNFAILRKSPVGSEYLLFSEDEQCVFLISASIAKLFLGETDL